MSNNPAFNAVRIELGLLFNIHPYIWNITYKPMGKLGSGHIELEWTIVKNKGSTVPN